MAKFILEARGNHEMELVNETHWTKYFAGWKIEHDGDDSARLPVFTTDIAQAQRFRTLREAFDAELDLNCSQRIGQAFGALYPVKLV